MKTATKSEPAKKRPAKKTRPATKASPAKKAAVKKVAMKHGARADLGLPIDGFFAKQPTHLRPILDTLRALVESTVPGTASSLKWGMPFYTLGGNMMCALGAHKAHVNLILAGPPEVFDDPRGQLEGAGKTGRHLKVTSATAIPTADVKKWLRSAAHFAMTGKVR